MTWGQTNSMNIPRLITYEAASKHYDSVKPIRGRAADIRPLAQRHKDNLTIYRSASMIKIRLYDTDIITYKVDGSIIINNGGYTTLATHDVMHGVLGIDIVARHEKSWVRFEQYGWLPLPSKTGTTIRLHEKSNTYLTYFTCDEPAFPIVHRMNRAKANSVRETVKPFQAFLLSLIKLQDTAWGINECIEIVADFRMLRQATEWKTKEELSELLGWMCSQNREEWLKAAMTLMQNRIWTPPHAKKAVDEVLFYMYGNEIFEPHVFESGTIIANPNRKFLRHFNQAHG